MKNCHGCVLEDYVVCSIGKHEASKRYTYAWGTYPRLRDFNKPCRSCTRNTEIKKELQKTDNWRDTLQRYKLTVLKADGSTLFSGFIITETDGIALGMVRDAFFGTKGKLKLKRFGKFKKGKRGFYDSEAFQISKEEIRKQIKKKEVKE